MIQRYDLAPLDGITKVVFRQVWHRHFGGADRYFIPFFSPTDHHTITPRDFRELDPDANAGLPTVPQIMSCKAPDFVWGAERMREEYLMPSARDLDTLDPDRIFDRPKTPSFHNVYIAPEADLPTDDA